MTESIVTKVEPFIPREPDWKQLYYSLALRVTSAFEQNKNGDSITASKSIESAMKIVTMTEAAIEVGNAIVTVAISQKNEQEKQ